MSFVYVFLQGILALWVFVKIGNLPEIREIPKNVYDVGLEIPDKIKN